MAGIETAETVGQVTPELLTSGEWEDVEFAEYNVEADAEQVEGGKVHILRQTAERVKDTSSGWGSRRWTDPTSTRTSGSTTACSCLRIIPRARTGTGSPSSSRPTLTTSRGPRRARRARSPGGRRPGRRGLSPPWDEDFARALALRGHTTSLSTRYLSGEEVAISSRHSGTSVSRRCTETTRSTDTLTEFFQIEGWVMAEDPSVRDLMGTFEEFYSQFGITDIQFKPHYNPLYGAELRAVRDPPDDRRTRRDRQPGIFREEMLEPPAWSAT